MTIDKTGKWWVGTDPADTTEYLVGYQAEGYAVDERAFADALVVQSGFYWKPTPMKVAPDARARPVAPSTSFVIALSTGMRPIQSSGPAPSAAIKSAIWGLGFPCTRKKTSGGTSVGSPWVIAARNAGRLGALSTGRSAMDPPINSLIKRENDRTERNFRIWQFLAVLASAHVRQLSEDHLPFVDGRPTGRS